MRDLDGLDGLLPLLESDPFVHGLSGKVVQDRLRRVLRPPAGVAVTGRRVGEWTRDGVDGAELEWDAGFGPVTKAWLLRPAGERRELPGVVALHCHGGVKSIGKEKIADGPQGVHPVAAVVRAELYDGAAYAQELARTGYAVLVHDVFGWGSRRMSVAHMPRRSKAIAELVLAQRRDRDEAVTLDREYDAYAGAHEDAMAKLLGVLGTSWGGVVVREDLIAVEVLRNAVGVREGGVAIVGLSGGGARAATASALATDGIRATIIASMMSTMQHVLDGYLHSHTWLMMNPGLGSVADWPDIAAAARPRPLFVGYGLNDSLFPESGMRAAHERLTSLYRQAGFPQEYQGTLLHEPHGFSEGMRQRAWSWLDHVFRSPSTCGA